MIKKTDIEERAREWGLRDAIVEKDYVLGWLLWGIGSDPVLGYSWIFKGGTCLKKAYIETYRFSEDLDFTILPEGPIRATQVEPRLRNLLQQITEECGIDFSVEPFTLAESPDGKYCEGRIFYRGPLGARNPARIKLDLSSHEQVVRPMMLRPIAHPYPDELPSPARIRCYSFEELFGEKIRAMGERARPRDLYDIIYLFRRPDFRQHPEIIQTVLVEKCKTKGIAVPTLESIMTLPQKQELESEWQNMLGHQLPILPPFQSYMDELASLFSWLEGNLTIQDLPSIPFGKDQDQQWSPPSTAWRWGTRSALETVRFAAANHLCIDLGYDGRTRLVEPYSLRRSKAGDLLLFGIKVVEGRIHCYRVDRIESIHVTTQPFRPRYRVEFTPSGSLGAPQIMSYRRSSGSTYSIRCTVCGKIFYRKKPSNKIGPHKAPGGWKCRGRHGQRI